MKSIFGAAIVVACTIGSFDALRCFDCSYSDRFGDTDLKCKIDPTYERLSEAEQREGQKSYCLTEMRTENGNIKVMRSFFFSNRTDMNGTCDEGPIEGKQPGQSYLKSCYCNYDACNREPYTSPPPISIAIKCFVCGKDDWKCNPDVENRYLVDIPTYPYFIKTPAISSTIFQGFSIMGVREEPSLQNFPADVINHNNNNINNVSNPWSTYCMTTISRLDGKVEVNRNATWSVDGNLNGKCVDSEIAGISHCFCNDRAGCNDKNGGNLNAINSAFVAITAASWVSFKIIY